jgi:hypothetical protein
MLYLNCAFCSDKVKGVKSIPDSNRRVAHKPEQGVLHAYQAALLSCPSKRRAPPRSLLFQDLPSPRDKTARSKANCANDIDGASLTEERNDYTTSEGSMALCSLGVVNLVMGGLECCASFVVGFLPPKSVPLSLSSLIEWGARK